MALLLLNCYSATVDFFSGITIQPLFSTLCHLAHSCCLLWGTGISFSHGRLLN